MKNIYIVRKYVLANNINDALKKEKHLQAQDCWMDENSTKNYTETLIENHKKKTGFTINNMKCKKKKK